MSVQPRVRHRDRNPVKYPCSLPGRAGFRHNLWMLLISVFLVFVGIGIQAVILNLYLIEIGYRADFLGLFSFANTAAIGGAALLASPLCTRFGHRRVLLAAIAVLALSTAGLVATVAAIPLILLAILNGIALAHIFVPSAPFIMDNARPEQRARAFAGYFAAQALASTVGSILGGILPPLLTPAPGQARTGYAWTLAIAAGVAGLAFLPLRLADDSKEADSHTSMVASSTGADDARQVHRDLAWMVVANGLTAASTGFAIPFLNVFFDQRLHASTATIGGIFAVGAGAMTIGSLAGPAVGKRFGTIPTVVICRVACVPVLLGLAFTSDIWVGSALYVVRTLFFTLTWPTDNAFSMELVPARSRATLAALRSTSWNLGWSIASGLAGLMIINLGFGSIFTASAVLLLAGCVVYFAAFRRRSPGAEKELPRPVTSV